MNVPTNAQALSTLARLTLTRTARGKLLWIGVGIACLPVLFAAGMAQGKQGLDITNLTMVIEMFVVAILPPLFGAPAVAEEIEDRTATYLWSRPIARWVIVAGKLLALAPFAAALVVASWCVAIFVSLHHLPSATSILGFGLGSGASAICACGIATLFPKRGMTLAIIYILVIDLSVGELPAGIRWLSVTHATRALGGFETDTAPAFGAIALAIISAVWLLVAFRRVRRLET